MTKDKRGTDNEVYDEYIMGGDLVNFVDLETITGKVLLDLHSNKIKLPTSGISEEFINRLVRSYTKQEVEILQSILNIVSRDADESNDESKDVECLIRETLLKTGLRRGVLGLTFDGELLERGPEDQSLKVICYSGEDIIGVVDSGGHSYMRSLICNKEMLDKYKEVNLLLKITIKKRTYILICMYTRNQMEKAERCCSERITNLN